MTIYLSATQIETNKGAGLEIVIVGLDKEKIAGIAEQLRQVLRENTKRIFGDNASLPQ